MNSIRIRRTAVAVAAAAALPFSLVACSSDGSDTAADDTTAAAEQNPGEQTETGMPEDGATTGTEPFGAGCSAVPEEGDGSFEGMADDPVATAASNNPELETLVQAIQEADLVDTLNSAEDITVFAPTNDAFAKIPESDLNALLEDKDELTKVLTYHVVDEPLAPEDLEDGSYQTLAEQELTVEGSGEDYTVNDESEVVCGNVQTANATVYLVDTVLMPEE